MSRIVLVPLLLVFAGCSTADALLVGSARDSLIGLPEDDLRLCAGIADREATTQSATFWTYDRGSPASGLSGSIPALGLGVNFSGNGECRMTFQLVGGRISRIGVSAAVEAGLLTDGACAPVVRGCMRMLRDGSITTGPASVQPVH